MAAPPFFLPLEPPYSQTLGQLKSHLAAMPKKQIASVTLGDLSSTGKYANGLYLMYSQDGYLWYVGKCTSRSFVDRIPSHFDQREGAWFATVPHRIQRVMTKRTYAEAHACALQLRLALVGIMEKSFAMRLERALRSYLEPKLNGTNPAQFSDHTPLSAI